MRDEIPYVDGLLFKSHPTVLRAEMLKIIHASHLGIVKCKSRARESLFWPAMAACIEDTVSKCSVCAKHTVSNHKEPLIQTETAERPWQIVSADIFEFKGNQYLVSVDHYSKWPELAKLDS